MKTLFSFIVLLVFTAIMIAPKIPAEYPPKKVLEERADIVLHELHLNNLINKIEYNIIVDSLKQKKIIYNKN